MAPKIQTMPQPTVKPEQVASYYDAWTDNYLEAFGECIQAHRPAKEKKLLEYLMERIGLQDGMYVLDAGCGVCGPARYFATRCDLRIEGVTISSVQARVASARNEAAGLGSKIRVTLGDFHRLSEIFGDNTFDAVYFLESLSHSAEPRHALQAAYNVLRPGGFVYIKDFFIRPCESSEEQKRVLDVVARVDRIFSTKTATSNHIIQHLNEIQFHPVFATAPRFDVDNTLWQRFEQKHKFDLFGGAQPFDWSEWLEIKFQKP
jgi:cyclopropane fatty-acyl-phospholipid synthase-like methyltransferase